MAMFGTRARMFATGRGFVKTKTPTKTMQNSDTFSDDRVSRRTRLSLSAPRGPTSMAAQRLPAEDDRQTPSFMAAGRMSEDLQDAAQQHLHDASGQDPQRSSIFFQDGSRARAAQQTPQHHTPIITGVDNTAAIKISEKHGVTKLTKHFDFCAGRLRDEVEHCRTSLKYVNTHDQTADIFTKALDEKTFIRHRNAFYN